MNLIEKIAANRFEKTGSIKKMAVSGWTNNMWDVYRVPLDELYYNDKNGRINTVYKQYKAEHGILKPEVGDSEYNKIFEEFIYKSNKIALNETLRSIEEKTQQEPGVVLLDGRVIDGNRRLTALRMIERKTGIKQTFDAIVLPLDFTTANDEKRIKELELELQLGREERVAYDTIDRIFDVYNTIEVEKIMTADEYKKASGAGNTKGINRDIRLAELMIKFIKIVSPGGNPIDKFYLARELKIDGPIEEIEGTINKLKSDKEAITDAVLTYLAVTKRKDIKVHVSEAVQEFIARNKYSIEQYRIMGEVYKNSIDNFPANRIEMYHSFSKIVQSEVDRPLKESHLRAAYFEYEMMRAANFSVPGAGKTAMLLGVFAYLNRFSAPEDEMVKRILVISPISAFDSWKREFKAVFGDKKSIRVIDSQNSHFSNLLDTDWGVSNLVLVNYESLPKHFYKLRNLMKSDTMLVYDEVHRVKNPYGQRAKYALELSATAKFRYVLTGTPIPNKYSDIYNLLNILYGNEYNSFFGWDVSELVNPKVRKIEEINESIHPFFWRTNKKDLNVPEAEADEVLTVEPSAGQMALVEAIYHNEKSSLAKLIRLIQVSTNPSLVNMAIDYDELMSFDDDDDKLERISGIDEKQFNELLGEDIDKMFTQKYTDFDLDSVVSPKFEKGIQLVTKLVSQGKKVLVWGIFVDTIVKISKALKDNNVKVNLVYGARAVSTPRLFLIVCLILANCFAMILMISILISLLPSFIFSPAFFLML